MLGSVDDSSMPVQAAPEEQPAPIPASAASKPRQPASQYNAQTKERKMEEVKRIEAERRRQAQMRSLAKKQRGGSLFSPAPKWPPQSPYTNGAQASYQLPQATQPASPYPPQPTFPQTPTDNTGSLQQLVPPQTPSRVPLPQGPVPQQTPPPQTPTRLSLSQGSLPPTAPQTPSRLSLSQPTATPASTPNRLPLSQPSALVVIPDSKPKTKKGIFAKVMSLTKRDKQPPPQSAPVILPTTPTLQPQVQIPVPKPVSVSEPIEPRFPPPMDTLPGPAFGMQRREERPPNGDNSSGGSVESDDRSSTTSTEPEEDDERMGWKSRAPAPAPPRGPRPRGGSVREAYETNVGRSPSRGYADYDPPSSARSADYANRSYDDYQETGRKARRYSDPSLYQRRNDADEDPHRRAALQYRRNSQPELGGKGYDSSYDFSQRKRNPEYLPRETGPAFEPPPSRRNDGYYPPVRGSGRNSDYDHRPSRDYEYEYEYSYGEDDQDDEYGYSARYGPSYDHRTGWYDAMGPNEYYRVDNAKRRPSNDEYGDYYGNRYDDDAGYLYDYDYGYADDRNESDYYGRPRYDYPPPQRFYGAKKLSDSGNQRDDFMDQVVPAPYRDCSPIWGMEGSLARKIRPAQAPPTPPRTLMSPSRALM